MLTKTVFICFKYNENSHIVKYYNLKVCFIIFSNIPDGKAEFSTAITPLLINAFINTYL